MHDPYGVAELVAGGCMRTAIGSNKGGGKAGGFLCRSTELKAGSLAKHWRGRLCANQGPDLLLLLWGALTHLCQGHRGIGRARLLPSTRSSIDAGRSTPQPR